MHGRTSVRSRLVRVMLGSSVLVFVVTLGLVVAMNHETAEHNRKNLEAEIGANIASKGRLLVTTHARMLRSMVLDNAFSDVERMVRETVEQDPEVVYGLFLGSDGLPWTYVPPAASARGKKDTWKDLMSDDGAVRGLSVRRRNALGHDVSQFAMPVIDEGEQLGVLYYGLSRARLHESIAAARAESDADQRRSIFFIAALMVAVALANVALLIKIASRIARPLADLTAAANDIAGGNRDVRVQVDSGDELQVLGQAFNFMQQINEDTFARLELEKEKAQESSRLKSEFLANMSHEIRTPMNGIIGINQLMLGLPLDRKMRRYAETVSASANALLTIINDVLDFSKIEAGRYELHNQAFDLRLLLQEIVELLGTRAYAKGVEIIHRVAPDVPATICTDPDRLRQVVTNLVGNAVKFTERGEVYVQALCERVEARGSAREQNVEARGSAREQNVEARGSAREQSKDEQHTTLRIEVHDTGPGIAQEDQHRLFSAFSQIDGSMVRRHGGTGLGLAISKGVVELMGGKIGFESRVGAGSCFWFTVPVERSEERVAQMSGFGATGRRVLIVEGSQRWRELLSEHMTAWQLEHAEAHTVEDAVARLRSAEASGTAFDTIVLGTVPDATTESALRALGEQGPKLPTIVLHQPGGGATALEVEQEMTAELSKPLRASDLYDCMVRTFRGGKRGEVARAPRASDWGQQPADRGAIGRDQRILVVDDNPINQFVAQEQLEVLGYSVRLADNGQQAVEIVQREKFALVLMDCQMPVMDGYTATRKIREMEKGTGQRVPIVALTAHALVGERDKVLAAGMDDYLTKPLREQTLRKAMKRHVPALATGALPDAKVGPEVEPREPVAEKSPILDGARSPRVVEVFLRLMPEQVAAVGEAVSRGIAADVRQTAHKVKGGCLSIGAARMASVAERLQHDAEQGDLSTATLLAVELEVQFEEVQEALVEERSRSSTSPSTRPASGTPGQGEPPAGAQANEPSARPPS